MSVTRSIWKLNFPIMGEVADGVGRKLPAGAKFLSCAIQYTDAAVAAWFEVDPHADESNYWFQIFGTGHTIENDSLVHLGTTLHERGTLVIHLYGSSEVKS